MYPSRAPSAWQQRKWWHDTSNEKELASIQHNSSNSSQIGNAGPCHASCLKKMKKTPEYYWAFSKDFTKKSGHEQRYEKGWYRIVYTKLPSGNYLSNIAWLNNRFLMFVSNRLHNCTPDQVKRWSRANRKRE